MTTVVQRARARLAHHRAMLLQFSRFAVVGGINSGADFLTYIILTRGFPHGRHRLDEANLAAYVVGITVSLLLNNFWTFRRDADRFAGRAFKFFLVAAGATAWNSLLFWTFTRHGVHDIVAKALATVLIASWNFSLYKYWVFRT